MKQSFYERKTTRVASNEKASIKFYRSETAIQCIIKNVSEGGAKLSFAYPIHIDLLFQLIHADGQNQHCRTIWIGGNEAGVQFINAPLGV
jgi:hypothetical protein